MKSRQLEYREVKALRKNRHVGELANASTRSVGINSNGREMIPTNSRL